MVDDEGISADKSRMKQCKSVGLTGFRIIGKNAFLVSVKLNCILKLVPEINDKSSSIRNGFKGFMALA
jgi:hypothetical protein